MYPEIQPHLIIFTATILVHHTSISCLADCNNLPTVLPTPLLPSPDYSQYSSWQDHFKSDYVTSLLITLLKVSHLIWDKAQGFIMTQRPGANFSHHHPLSRLFLYHLTVSPAHSLQPEWPLHCSLNVAGKFLSQSLCACYSLSFSQLSPFPRCICLAASPSSPGFFLTYYLSIEVFDDHSI